MDKKYIPQFENLPYANKNFESFFKGSNGVAGELAKIFDSVSHMNSMCGEPNFEVYVGEDIVQTISPYAGLNFITKLGTNGEAQYCYGTMHDGLYSNTPKLINFSVQQGKGSSVIVTYSKLSHNGSRETSSCGMEIISEDGHSFMQNSTIQNKATGYVAARSEIGRYEGNSSYSQISQVEGEDALNISADKKDLLTFAGQISKLTEPIAAIDGVEVAGISKIHLDDYTTSINSALSDICAQNFEQ